MQIVQFKDGSCAIRKKFLFTFRYLELRYGQDWYFINSPFMRMCVTEDMGIVKKLYCKLHGPTDYGIPLDSSIAITFFNCHND